MKEYWCEGNAIGIIIHADSEEDAIEKAEEKLLQGLGGYVEVLRVHEEEN